MEKVRIQLELDTSKAEFLDRFRVASGAATQKELINNAITIFRWAAKQVAAGRTIAAIDEQSETLRELQMPALEAAGAYEKAHPGTLDIQVISES